MENVSAKNNNVVNLTFTALMAALICICGPLSLPLPISPVPISLTNLAIYFTVMLIGWKRGTVAYIVYLLIGLVGVPVFSAFTGGPGKLLGPTGGYLIGFIFMTIIAGLFVEKFEGKYVMYFVGMILGTIVTYIFGTAWLAFQAHMGFKAALFAGVIPFIPGDLAKMVIAVFVGGAIRKRLQKARIL
ncbi:MAG: biotin transporter BioY [Anaerovoracaceae bacterium]|nr:biotin transporter BioY [Bacillota bacterium]MDY2669983.1 biotin transporter BioY [Anaerovoracaceae bacterium]